MYYINCLLHFAVTCVVNSTCMEFKYILNLYYKLLLKVLLFGFLYLLKKFNEWSFPVITHDLSHCKTVNLRWFNNDNIFQTSILPEKIKYWKQLNTIRRVELFKFEFCYIILFFYIKTSIGNSYCAYFNNWQKHFN